MWARVISLICVICALVALLKCSWKRLRVYFYASKLPGPVSVPLIGTLPLLTSAPKDFHKTIQQLCESQPPVFRLWIGSDIYIVNSQPEDLEILLNSCLNKPQFYEIWNDVLNNTILTAPADTWKQVRKMMNPSFSTQLINSFYDIFVKYSTNIVTVMTNMCGKEVPDLITIIWKFNLDSSLETIANIHDFSSLQDRHDFIPLIMRAEQIFIERFQKPWMLVDFLWRFSHLRRELMSIRTFLHDYGSKILDMQKQEWDALDSGKYKNLHSWFKYFRVKLVLDQLKKKSFVNLLTKEKIKTENETIEELAMMVVAASETTSIVTTFVLLILGLYPEIQDKVYDEISSVTGDSEDFSLKTVGSMAYLDRVIKETMRIFDPTPVIMRSIDKDVQIGSNIFPAGSNLIVPIGYLHRRPDFWPDPMKFDPDRFLPEEVEKRPRYAYIPFSLGPRNCIGSKYATISVKTMLAHILKHFKMKPLNYSSLEELQTEYHVLLKPVKFRIMFERRESEDNELI